MVPTDRVPHDWYQRTVCRMIGTNGPCATCLLGAHLHADCRVCRSRHTPNFGTLGPAVVAESKSFSLVEDGILYNAVLLQGFPGIFSRKELLAFFEDKFYAQERYS